MLSPVDLPVFAGPEGNFPGDGGTDLGACSGRSFRSPQFLNDLRGGFAGIITAIRGKRNGANTGVAATTVSLTDFRQVQHILLIGPGIGANGHFHAKAAAAQANAVHGIRVQVVRNKLVVALKVMI
jgi:hypothetical protein